MEAKFTFNKDEIDVGIGALVFGTVILCAGLGGVFGGFYGFLSGLSFPIMVFGALIVFIARREKSEQPNQNPG